MSPASQGALEVERYIGSCLISSTGRPALQKPLGGCRKQEQQAALRKQCQSQFGSVGTWAGGAPLISMASNPRRNGQRSPPHGQQQQQQQINHEQQLHNNRVPLSRLAVHTQGAPLILSGRFHGNRAAKIHNGQGLNGIANCVAGLINGCTTGGNVSAAGNNISNASTGAAIRCHPPPRLNKSIVPDQKRLQQQQQQPSNANHANGTSNKDGTTMMTATTAAGGTNVANIDSLSIASDESSGSNNSENSLPRIIKPRKRRKKDRKPPVVSVVSPPNATTTTLNDSKAADELQQIPLVVPSGLQAEQQQQQQQQQAQQLKSYNAVNSYDNARYPSDNYYKSHRRPANIGNNRENGYNRLHPGSNNACANNAPVNGSNSSTPPNSSAQQEVVDTRQQQHMAQRNNGYAAHRHVQVKVLDDNRNVILPVPVCQAKAAYLRHNNGARFLHDFEEPVTLACHQDEDCLQGSVCQCRYCDPATLVWDISEQNAAGYSPQYLSSQPPADYHHHHHHHRYSQVPATLFLRPSFICQEHANAIEYFDVGDNQCLRLRGDKVDGAAILRRSWSDPSSYFSEDIVPNRDVGVIGDRGHSGDSPKGRSSWQGDASTALSSSAGNQPTSPNGGLANGSGGPGVQGPLEVSTEIVTSPNGHRDLEIKFYSSSPTSYSTSPEDAKSAFTFPEDDATNDSEEFSDIWSYHESKLQQDFRTLLQAEE